MTPYQGRKIPAPYIAALLDRGTLHAKSMPGNGIALHVAISLRNEDFIRYLYEELGQKGGISAHNGSWQIRITSAREVKELLETHISHMFHHQKKAQILLDLANSVVAHQLKNIRALDPDEGRFRQKLLDQLK